SGSGQGHGDAAGVTGGAARANDLRRVARPDAGLNPYAGMEMGFVGESKVKVPDGTAKSEVEDRKRAEAAAAAQLVGEGHLLRVWKRPLAHGESTIGGLYRAHSDEQDRKS